MKLRFVKVNPAQNMTILVTSPVPRASQPEIAARLMAYGSVFAEQVGFVEPPTIDGACARLQMMGGEFCGNASMSLAAMLAWQGALADGASTVYPLEVSGTNGIVRCTVTRDGEIFRAEAEMPLPKSIEPVQLEADLRVPVVRFDGIAHAIVPETALTKTQAERKLFAWNRTIPTDAFGILLTDDALTRIRPLVGVRATDTRVWERGCASGTAALGAYAALQSGRDMKLRVNQPGGVIGVSARVKGDALTELTISTDVRIVADGEAYI